MRKGTQGCKEIGQRTEETRIQRKTEKTGSHYLQRRRIRGDLIATYKSLNGREGSSVRDLSVLLDIELSLEEHVNKVTK